MEEGVSRLNLPSNTHSLLGVPKTQTLHRSCAQVFKTPKTNTEKFLYWFFKKASGGALLSTFIWMGGGPCPRQKSLSSIPSGTTPLWMYQICFAARLLNDSISWVASNYKTPEALRTQKTGWSSSLPLLLPQVLPSYQVTQAEQRTHLDSTAPQSIQTPHKTRPHGALAGSLDDRTFFLQLLWNWCPLSFT